MVMFLLVAALTACDAARDSGAHTDSTPLAECDVDAMALGLTHRATASSCDPSRSPLAPADASCGSRSDDTCATHDACTAAPGGRCRLVAGEGNCSCGYDECQVDEDCSASAVCACGEVGSGRDTPVNRCVRADCRLDSDCPSGLCLASVGAESCTPPDAYVESFACATEADTCRNDDACDACLSPGARCRQDDDGSFACAEIDQASCE